MRVFEEYLAGDRGLQVPGLRVYILGVGGKPPRFQIKNKNFEIRDFTE